MWKRLVASAPAGAGKTSGQSCNENSTRFGLAALALSCGGKNLLLTLVLRNAFFFFSLLLFPRRLPWVYK